jgi:hypothetical protein
MYASASGADCFCVVGAMFGFKIIPIERISFHAGGGEASLLRRATIPIES